MSLEKYDVLKNKVMTHMDGQVKEIKMLAVEQWARENGFKEVIFSDYESARIWVEQNINSDKKYRKEFNKFEKELDEELSSIINDLKMGTKSPFEKKVSKISKKYVTPVAKMVIKSIMVNFLITQGMGLGLNIASNKIHQAALERIDKIDFTSGIDFDVNMPAGFFQGAADKVTNALESQTQNVAESIENGLKTSLTNSVDGATNIFQNDVVPFSQKVTSGILGFFQAKGIIKNAKDNIKINDLENQNDEQKDEIESLKQQVTDIKQKEENKKIEDKIREKRKLTISNIGKVGQMNFTVSQLQKIFKDEGINIPDIPPDCLDMEEYGTFLRNYLNEKNISKDEQKEIFTVINLYENNIESLCKELKLGKAGVVEKFKKSIDSIPKNILRGAKNFEDKITYNMERLVRNAISHNVSKEDVDRYVSASKNRDLSQDICIE